MDHMSNICESCGGRDMTFLHVCDWCGEIFEPGETWEFIIQDFANPLAPPAPFGSLGIASVSFLTTNSSGSIIAVPEPVTLSLLALSGLAVLIRRRR